MELLFQGCSWSCMNYGSQALENVIFTVAAWCSLWGAAWLGADQKEEGPSKEERTEAKLSAGCSGTYFFSQTASANLKSL